MKIQPVTDPEIVAAYNGDALGYTGTPEGVFRPGDEKEISQILQWCRARGKSLTPVALRSSTTGACVGHEGFLLSTEHLDKIVDIRPDTHSVVVQPGKNLGELKTELQRHGLFFPPDPTSENECSVGGAVACNASGARTLKYGATRRWVRSVRIVPPRGDILDLSTLSVDKNTTGYYGFQDPAQFFIGSEGTLGVITLVELNCLPLPGPHLACFAFFPDETTALDAVVAIRDLEIPVRCLEFFDKACLELLQDVADTPFPKTAGGMLFFEQEVAEENMDAALEDWLATLEKLNAAVDDTMLGNTPARQREMKELRHMIPSTLNETGATFAPSGGGKISTDWAVPYPLVSELVSEARSLCRKHDLHQVYCYGHLGNGHPHFNLMTRDPDERLRAEAAVREMCRSVCARGGTISAEHGIGKIKKPFLPLMYPPRVLNWMKEFKRMMDPDLIMAPGNILDF